MSWTCSQSSDGAQHSSCASGAKTRLHVVPLMHTLLMRMCMLARNLQGEQEAHLQALWVLLCPLHRHAQRTGLYVPA